MNYNYNFQEKKFIIFLSLFLFIPIITSIIIFCVKSSILLIKLYAVEEKEFVFMSKLTLSIIRYFLFFFK